MKTYRGNMQQSVDPQDALLSLDAFCRKYEAFLCDLLKVTSRPTSKMLCDATAKVWPGQSPLEQKTFNNHVSEVVKVLFGKARSMTTRDRAETARQRQLHVQSYQGSWLSWMTQAIALSRFCLAKGPTQGRAKES